MNYVQIAPVTVPIKGNGTYLEVRSLGFPLNPTSVSFYYAIRKETTVDQEGTPVSVPGETVLEGNLTMDRAAYDLWSNDDSYVFDWAAAQLGLTIVEEEL
jgi:hypothetical protein